MVAAQYRLLTGALGVNHLLLVMGTSMGGMHTWIWGEKYPDFMDRLVPLASVPTQIAGRNRVMRKMIADAIRSDPQWHGGDYQEPPRQGLIAALNVLLMMTSSPLQWHKLAPTRDQADAFLSEQIRRRVTTTDANDLLYAFDASRDYDPSTGLEKIIAPVLAINSADDVVNPPELGLMEALLPRVKRGRYVLIPTSDATRGHGTHSWPAVWGKHLEAFLRETAAPASPADLSAAAAAEVRTGVEATLDAFRAASAAGDWNKVISFYLDSPDFRWIERGHVEYRSVDEIRKSLIAFPAGTKIHTTYRDTEIIPRTADVAVVVTRFETRVAIPQSGGFRFDGALTIDLVRRDGAWRFAAGHTASPAASPNPNR
jgi:pimeloyl-ACP methyl ester carboxylesterase/ketosteroid isomerase-like protein